MTGMRDTVTHPFQKRIANPVMRRLPFQTLLETTGRTSGRPRRRLRELPQVNSFGVRTFGTDLLTVRVDLTG